MSGWILFSVIKEKLSVLRQYNAIYNSQKEHLEVQALGSAEDHRNSWLSISLKKQLRERKSTEMLKFKNQLKIGREN